jgi:ferredoxin
LQTREQPTAMPSRDPDVAVAEAAGGASGTQSLVVRLGGREQRIEYRSGDTVLEAVRRAGLEGPFNCQQGNRGTCMARLEKGAASMRRNSVLDDDEIEAGWVLTCQAVPTSREVVVVYEF